MKKGTKRVQKRGDGAPPTANRFTEEFSGQFRLNPAKFGQKNKNYQTNPFVIFQNAHKYRGFSRSKGLLGKKRTHSCPIVQRETSQISPFRAPSSSINYQPSSINLLQVRAPSKPFKGVYRSQFCQKKAALKRAPLIVL